ncbi:SPFH domain-containing protein [Paenibacillus sp. M1]|uniref:SPFH domain-containing protein n=1 Tax=Paenibacillus haidiansis TaxID=1574488 RepID=A0ABU7VKD7_9BACL
MALIEVIKYDGSPDVFAWKHPDAELGTWTQLIVNQSQEVILFKDGKALDLFGAGRHTLSTANIPILSNIINLPFGGNSPFAAEVWYVNKASSLDVKWGTPKPVHLQDPKYNIIVPVRAFGQFGIQIEDSRKFLVKLVGTLRAFTQDHLVEYFRGIITMNINSMLSSYLVNKRISVLEINAFIGEMSAHFEQSLAPALEEYGIRLLNLYIHNINLPEDDPSVIRLREALARKAEMDIIGFTYQQERTFNTLEGAAKNEGSMQAGLMGAGIGLGMGYGVGGPLSNEMSQMTKVLGTANQSRICGSCRHANDEGSAFCSACGKPLAEQTVQTGMESLTTCNACGSPLLKGAKFCPNCGDKYHACPKCGTDNPESATECVNCKEPLASRCPNCSQEVPAGSKFCASCGTSVSAAKAKCKNCQHELEPGQKFCPQCGSNQTEGGGQ